MGAPIVDGAIGRPGPALAAHVSRATGYRLAGHEPGVHLGLPSPSLPLVISLDAPVATTALPDPRQTPGAFIAPTGGLHTTPVRIVHDGDQHGLHLELAPLGARALLGLPASALAGTVVELDELLGRRAAELVDRVAAAAGWVARFAVVDEVLARGLTEHPGPRPEVVRAWQLLLATGGSISVTELAAEVGWSRRHLAQRFRAELGLSPKVAARVVRFDRARRRLERSGHRGLAAVAAECGYFDQAHLTRDWHDLAGCTPTAWMAAEGLPSVQDGTIAVTA
jgi:AraC-like DNA-binding protein